MITGIEKTTKMEDKNDKYRIHPSPQLVAAYKNNPFQGQHPQKASVIFFGIDANYASDIESDKELFNILLDYHKDGVAYWKNNENGDHHPFLLPLYRNRPKSEGLLYHDTFRKMALPQIPCADAISFVELLNVPTTGKLSEDKEKLFDALLCRDHLKEVQEWIFEGNKLVFMPNEVIERLKVVKGKNMFDWLDYHFVRAMDTPVIYRNERKNITVRKILHFSSAFHRNKILEQGEVIRKLILDSLG